MGSIPDNYEAYLVPLIFEPYAVDLAARAAARPAGNLLEIAAGTGVLTRQLAASLPDSSIVATDLNQPMLDRASAIGTKRPVEWRQADALALPFPDHSFDVVTCQFGVMFFPDRAKAFSETGRVLRPGGTLIFSVWDRLEQNEFADVVSQAVAGLFPSDPPGFLARTPYGYHDRKTIERDLSDGGFHSVADMSTVPARSRADSPRIPAVAFCLGTPLLNEIEDRDPARLDEVTDRATELIAARFGNGAVDAKIQAIVVTVEKE